LLEIFLFEENQQRNANYEWHLNGDDNWSKFAYCSNLQGSRYTLVKQTEQTNKSFGEFVCMCVCLLAKGTWLLWLSH
jgi:hypothetical protein